MENDIPNKFNELIYRFNDPEIEGDWIQFNLSANGPSKDNCATVITISDRNVEAEVFMSDDDLGRLFFILKRYLNA